jgi:hypothetical protein
MKRQNSDWDREKKIHKIVKGTDKTSKYKKSIYNMLSDEEEESDFDSDDSELLRNYNQYVKRR